MSVAKLAEVLKTPMDDPIAKFILVVLADHYNDSTGECWPSVATIASITGCSRATVLRKLKQLEQSGMIARRKRYNKTDLYEIQVGVNLTGVTVTPLEVSQCDTNSYGTLNIKKKAGKIKLVDWQPDDDCKQYAKQHGLSADSVWQSIQLWNEQNGNKAAYASPSAFFKNWCRREADKPQRGTYSKPSGQNFGVAEKKRFTVAEWSELTQFWQNWYKQNRPSALPEGVR